MSELRRMGMVTSVNVSRYFSWVIKYSINKTKDNYNVILKERVICD